MFDFRIGMKVVCIRDPIPQPLCPYPIFRKGQVYTITSFEDVNGEIFITVAEINPLVTGALDGFRPIVDRPTSIEFAHDILRKATRTDEVSA